MLDVRSCAGTGCDTDWRFFDQTDHSGLIRNWVAMAKKRLVHPETGLLISNFTTAFTPVNGPEGSSLWMIAHGLQLLDVEFAREQYTRARKELSRITVGFGYAREWPSSWETAPDIDSRQIIPFFKISAGSSGMAFIGATAFKDEEFVSSLAATLNFAGFPASKRGRLKYSRAIKLAMPLCFMRRHSGLFWSG